MTAVAIVQTPAEADTVVDALSTLAPGWHDRTGVSHENGWTSVPMRPDAAQRFAPLLARLLGSGVLCWERDGNSCKVTYYHDGEVFGPVESADTHRVDEFIKAFERRQPVNARPATGDDRSTWLKLAAVAPVGSFDRNKALASVLGVPYPEPVEPSATNPASPTMSEASVAMVAEPFRRRQRLEQARKVVSIFAFASGLATVAFFFSPGWPVNVIVLAVALVLFGVRTLLGLRAKRLREAQAGVP